MNVYVLQFSENNSSWPTKGAISFSESQDEATCFSINTLNRFKLAPEKTIRHLQGFMLLKILSVDTILLQAIFVTGIFVK